MAGLFRVLDEVVQETRTSLLGVGESQSDSARFDRAVLGRGLNILEAAQILLPVAHWEAASGLARQLFELLVNMEEIGRQADPSEARLRYSRYGLLQHLLEHARRTEYNRATGRPVDGDRVGRLDEVRANPDFGEFRQGNDGWRRSWSGASVRTLAIRSASSIRAQQYEQLFRRWSEEVHAAPSTIVREMFRSQSSETWIEEDKRKVGEVLSMIVVLYLELEGVLAEAPHLSWERKLAWTEALRTEAMAHGWVP